MFAPFAIYLLLFGWPVPTQIFSPKTYKSYFKAEKWPQPYEDGRTRQIDYYDQSVSGLHLRVSSSGTLTWMLFARITKNNQRKPWRGSLGRGGKDGLTVDEARAKAIEWKNRIAAGWDPSAKDREVIFNPTMADLWARVSAEHYGEGRAWDLEAGRIWRRYLAPALSGDLVREISYDDCVKVRDSLRDKPAQANLAIAVLSKMLSLAELFGPEGCKWRPLGSNPCQKVARFPARKRKRHASASELADIGDRLRAELEATPPRTLQPLSDADEWRLNIRRQVAFIYLLLFSGARPSEIIKLKPDMIERFEIDGAIHGAFSMDGKTTRETGDKRRVYLPPEAMAVLDMLPRDGIPLMDRHGNAGESTVTGLAGVPRDMWNRVKPAGMWLRDCRRTFATIGYSSGVRKDVMGDLLGHRDPRTTAIYAHLAEGSAQEAAAKAARQVAELMRNKNLFEVKRPA